MKKFEINKIVIFVGFVFYVLGMLLDTFSFNPTFVASLQATSIYVLLGAFFIYAKNTVVQKIGYGLCAISGIIGLYTILWTDFTTGALISSCGSVIMLLGSIIVFITLILSLFGFTKGSSSKTNDVISSLSAYSSLKDENVITDEEFTTLKQSALENCNGKSLSFSDLKQWKKLLDQKIITEEEFTSVKADLFKK